MKYKKINLPYPTNSLEPYIDKLTVETHYDKHHTTYESKFNFGAKGTEIEKYTSIEEVMLNYNLFSDELRPLIKNSGGGLINHNFYWNQFTLNRNLTNKEIKYRKIIINQFKSIDILKEEILLKGLSIFGSGWVWAVIIDGKLEVITTPNQENPWMKGITDVVIGIDVWEHAYYLKYKQDRKTYIENVLKLIDLSVIKKEK